MCCSCLRKCNNGESRVFDESVSEFGSGDVMWREPSRSVTTTWCVCVCSAAELGSGSGAVLTRPLSDLSISSEATSSGGGSTGVVQPPPSSHRQQPASCEPHMSRVQLLLYI